MTQPRYLRIIEAMSVTLFFFQGLTVCISVLFGIIYDQVFAGSPGPWLVISVLLVAAALVTALASPSGPTRSWLAVLASITGIARVALSINNAEVRFCGSLVVLATGGLYLAGLLTARRPAVLPAVLGGLALQQVLQAVGLTYDVTLQPWWLPIQIVWGALVVVLAAVVGRRSAAGDRRAGQLGVWSGLGLGGLIFMETSLLALPNAAARWSDTSYPFQAVWSFVVAIALLIPRVRHEVNHRVGASQTGRVGMAVALPLAILLAYFSNGLVSELGLMLSQVLALTLLACLIDARSYRPRQTGGMLALGLGMVLLLNFLNAFAFTYPYSLPFMRGLGWLPYLLAAGLAGAGITGQEPVTISWNELSPRLDFSLPFGIVGVAAIILATRPQPVASLPSSGVIRIASYNIHYGYDRPWHFTLDDIARTIQDEQVDVIALQEVDTGRLTSYAVDDARYLGLRLRMNVAYLPTVERLTGIALLYKGPAAPFETRMLSSLQEQTGIIHVPLEVDHRPLHAFAIWLGLDNEDTERQIEEALDFIDGRSPASFGGDFNNGPESAVAANIEQAGFEDPFITLGINPPPLTDPAIDPTQRIDFVWLRDLVPEGARVPESLASDHRMVVVDVEWGP
jgi:endonuclease/exonuclease/phosphatase family metal-dependent hydrolase